MQSIRSRCSSRDDIVAAAGGAVQQNLEEQARTDPSLTWFREHGFSWR
jgi:hypothetical protein